MGVDTRGSSGRTALVLTALALVAAGCSGGEERADPAASASLDVPSTPPSSPPSLAPSVAPDAAPATRAVDEPCRYSKSARTFRSESANGGMSGQFGTGVYNVRCGSGDFVPVVPEPGRGVTVFVKGQGRLLGPGESATVGGYRIRVVAAMGGTVRFALSNPDAARLDASALAPL